MSGRGLALALRLHPGGYRRERGAELAAVFAESTAGASRRAVALELLDLAAHGLRLRLGLGSAGALARSAALAAPFAATAAAATTLMWQVTRLWLPLQHAGVLGPMLRALVTSTRPDFWLDQVGVLLTLGSALAAGLGRWTTARLAGLVSLPVLLTRVALYLPESTSWAEGDWPRLIALVLIWYGPQVLWLLVLLAAPRDLLGPPTRRRTGTALAGALFGGFVLNSALGLGPVRALNSGLASELPAAVLGAAELALLAAAVPALRRGRPGPA
ncbi:hypothetical protein, partial [Kitasatospora sp. LaBMicrA B282]|uniref:hypothetical protein n=1 Tax=Kitasatospora sp. LaBMicrA B282 TaxID=3420949 RepID=UPI003D149EF5